MKESFRTRFGLMMALVGMSVGTGNIWRFPRVMSQNGGGTFLIPWMIFLFLWSIPLLTVEFSLGKRVRKGVVGCFHSLTDGKLTWMGGFVAFCTLGIMLYYSVVTGWCLHYMLSAFSGTILQGDSRLLWEGFSRSSSAPLLMHIIVIVLTALVIIRGVESGIEKISRLLIPLLFIILIGLAFYARTLIGSNRGIEFMLNFDLARLKDYKIWLEALTQSAWSTGAGWGLTLTYACYARHNDHPIQTPFITGLTNNFAEILASLVILPTLFTFFPFSEAIKLTGEGNTGLTFIALPGLFRQMNFGWLISIAFFTALFFAAFTSLIAMFELGTVFLKDLGIERKKGVILLGVLTAVFGAPSALNMNFFENQDWVWGIGLLVSGFFFTVLVHHIDSEHFTKNFVGIRGRFGRQCLRLMIHAVIPLEFIALIAWWFHQAIQWDPKGWWHPFHTFSIGTCLFQWGILILVLFLFNRRMSQRIRRFHLKDTMDRDFWVRPPEP